jgi:hypothetical protein
MQARWSSLPVIHMLASGGHHLTAVLCVAAVDRMKLPLGGINMTRIKEQDQQEPPDTLLKVRSALVSAPRTFSNKIKTLKPRVGRLAQRLSECWMPIF